MLNESFSTSVSVTFINVSDTLLFEYYSTVHLYLGVRGLNMLRMDVM